MAKAPISQEEIQLRKRARRRLVGASFLVLVMIIVLPMILDSEPRPQAESVRVEMPAPSRDMEREPARGTKESPSASAPSQSLGAIDDKPQDSEAAVKSPETIPGAPAVPSEKEALGETATPNETTTSLDGEANKATLKPPLVIQLGTFSKPENAKQLQDALVGNRIKVFAEEVRAGNGSKTRVRAGPFDSLAEAEQVRERISKMNLKLGIDPKIVAKGQ